MSDALSTIQLKVDSGQAKSGLMELTAAISQFKTALSSLGTLTDGYTRMRAEVQALKTQLAEVRSTSVSTASQESEALGRNKTVWASYRASIDGVSYSYREVAKLSKDQIKDSMALTEAVRKEKDERKLAAQQMQAQAEDAKRLRQRLNGGSANEELYQAEMKASANRLALEQRTRAQLKLELEQEVADAKAATAAKLAEQARAAAAQEAAAAKVAAFMAASAKSQLTTLRSAYVYGQQGGDVSAKYGSHVAELAKLDEINRRTLNLAGARGKAGDAAREQAMHEQVLHSALRGTAGALDNLWLTYSRYAVVMASVYATVMAIRTSMTQGANLSYDVQFAAALSDKVTSPAQAGQLKDSVLSQLPNTVKDLPFSANEAAKALRAMAQAGVDADQGLKLLPTSAKAAIMGETDLKTAAEGLINTMEVFGLKSTNAETFAKNFQHVGDVTARVASNTSASFNDVLDSFKSATGVANLYKVSLEEVAATVEVLGKAGIKGSSAGTFSRNFISNLYTAQSDAAKMIKQELGVSAFDSQTGKMKDYVTVVNELYLALSKLDEKSLTLTFEKLFNERSSRPAGELLDKFKELASRVNDLKASEGTLDGFVKRLEGAAKIEWQDALARGSDLLSLAFKGAEKDVSNLAKSFKALVTDPEIIRGLSELVKLVAQIGTFIADISKFKADYNIPTTAFSPITAPTAIPWYLATRRASGTKEEKAAADQQGLSMWLDKQPSGQMGNFKAILSMAEGSAKAERPHGTKTIDPDAIKDRAAQARAEQQAIQEQFRYRETLAKEVYDYEAGLLDKRLEKGLISEAEFSDRRSEVEKKYLDSVKAAESEAWGKINGLREAAEKESQRMQLSNSIKAIQDRISAEERAHQLAKQRRIELSRIDTEALAKTVRSKDLPALEAKEAGARDKSLAKRDEALMSSGDKAALEARLKVEDDYRTKLAEVNAEIQKATELQGGETSAVRELVSARDELITSMNAQAEASAALAKREDEYHRSFEYGAKRAYSEFANAATNSSDTAYQAFSSAMNGMAEGLATFSLRSKTSFKSFISEILLGIAKAKAAAALSGLFGAALNYAFPSSKAAGVEESAMITVQGHHLGGLVGTEPTFYRSVPSDLFSGATRYHTGGIAGSEVPIIANRGEGVFTPEQMANLAPVGQGGQVTVTNHIKVEASGQSSVSTDSTGQQAALLGRMIEQATLAIISREQRPGGLLYGG